MSNWSSFEEDKKYADAWREFLSENEDEEIELDEGLWDKIKTAGKAASAAWKGHDVSKQFARASGARAAMAASGEEVPGLSKLPATGAPPEEEEEAAPETPEQPPQIQMPDAPVALFTGDNALYSKLFSTIMARFKNKDIQGQAIQLDKATVQNTVKQILKDLSAQLRANGIKVQESSIPMLADLILEELERTLLIEASKSSKRRERDYARSLKGSKMGTGTSHVSTATAGQGKKDRAAAWVADGKPAITQVNNNNKASRAAAHYANSKKGTLKPAALELAKAQLAWLQQNKPDDELGIGDELTKVIKTTEADPQAKHYGGDKTGTGSRVAPTKGQVDAGRAVGGKITALIGQAAGADIKDRDMRKMIGSEIQQDLKAIIMKIVKPHLQKHLQNKGVKLRETKARTNEKK